jgi:hypothetical protein
VRKEIELLKDHADVAAHLVNLLEVARQLDAIDDDTSALMRFETVDTADQCRFARS